MSALKMIGTVIAAAVAATAAYALMVLTLTRLAHADPPCAAFDTCQYMPNPYYDGPLMPTWDTPGYYGGWTTGPVMCDPHSYTCRGVAPMP